MKNASIGFGSGIVLMLICIFAFNIKGTKAYDPSISVTATLDFTSTSPLGSSTLTTTATGAAVGDVVAIGLPNGSVPANGTFVAWVSATNTVSVRYTNTDELTTYDPTSGSFKIKILK